ncbi:hypothetical protein [Priestia koreensis]|nr:hypothetical protein [Priestia koreensis]
MDINDVFKVQAEINTSWDKNSISVSNFQLLRDEGEREGEEY